VEAAEIDPFFPEGTRGVDPLANKFPAWSPYNYTMNNPVNMVDPDGRAAIDPILAMKTSIGIAVNVVETVGKIVGLGEHRAVSGSMMADRLESAAAVGFARGVGIELQFTGSAEVAPKIGKDSRIELFSVEAQMDTGTGFSTNGSALGGKVGGLGGDDQNLSIGINGNGASFDKSGNIDGFKLESGGKRTPIGEVSASYSTNSRESVIGTKLSTPGMTTAGVGVSVGINMRIPKIEN
jgi:hypothetical protein